MWWHLENRTGVKCSCSQVHITLLQILLTEIEFYVAQRYQRTTALELRTRDPTDSGSKFGSNNYEDLGNGYNLSTRYLDPSTSQTKLSLKESWTAIFSQTVTERKKKACSPRGIVHIQ